ncbi:hypothetical protein Pth03_74040 [Planotetraspora thailandica]|uniref:Uncharacterized protein n=1 Tax=Planotetraspora thailandica TaxID=487172 RepID=A0A8J3Y1B1_9ACTN|nr:DUF6368 family protein [Planotetraspora thailandica]GII59015.1 hypothetical protein Pth03_74040 [Planotetraspora thailandica]
MSVPGVTLLLFESLDQQSRGELAHWLRTFGVSVEAQVDGTICFKIGDGSVLAMPDWDGSCEFGLAIGDWDPEPGDDYSQMERQPVQELSVWARGTEIQTQMITGRLVLALMQRLSAVVDFDGLLGPSPWAPTGMRGEEEARLAEVHSFVTSLPGWVCEVGYMTIDGSRWYSHVGDAEFLEAWLRHPAFHLVIQ